MAIQSLANVKVCHKVENSGNEHALIIIKNIFETAQSDVTIVAYDLRNKEVSNAPEYVNALKDFLDRDNVSLRIFLSEFDKTIMDGMIMLYSQQYQIQKHTEVTK